MLTKKLKKKAIELSVNFIVVLILSIVVFASGIVLFKKFFEKAENMRTDMNAQTDAELERMLLSTDRVVILNPRRDVKINEPESIGIGFLNTLDQPETNFYVDFVCKAKKVNEFKPCKYVYDNDKNLTIAYFNNYQLTPNQRQKFNFVVMPKKPNNYIIDICICNCTTSITDCTCLDYSNNKKNCGDSGIANLYTGHVYKIYLNAK